MNICLLFLLFLAEPQTLHSSPTVFRDPQSTAALLARARVLLDHLQKEPPAPRRAAPAPPEPPFDMASIVKPFFTYEGVAPLLAPQQSDRKTQ